MPARNFGGHAYHGRLAWEGGRWRHEMHNGRMGWWWDVGGVWYFYPQPMEGPPAYVSDVEVYDDAGGPDGPPVADGYPPPGGYPPPAGAYAPPPPPPPAPDPAASIVGGAVVGGLLGGLISGRPVGAAVGAVTGATAGAIVGAQATRRPGYYWSQGSCYYRYPSGQYAPVDPAYCG
ncbi:glycine zipper domain-containing protein [Bradyrhizobium jicamae]|uniref:glycine zipper domain-containing protein n=1 Tax=Bradyrhizobium jicamae TaxID=280332 RepID=UPI0039083B35